MNLNLRDEVEGYGKVTKIEGKSIWFGEKRFLLESLLKKDLKVLYFESPDPQIDWRNGDQVDAYYKTFNQWKGVIRMGDVKSRELLEVKNNKVLYQGEYYLPYYSHYLSSNKTKVFREDGHIFGYCLKLHNAFYSTQTQVTVNVFHVDMEVSPELLEYNKLKQKNAKELPTLDYLKTLNLNQINTSDLALMKTNFTGFFDKSIFPYTVNKVTFRFGNLGKIEVLHRNRSGYLKIDNGYHGSMPFRNDYSVILVCAPYFTNEHGTYTRCERGEITWDKAMLDKLAGKIIEAWDRAIENNFRIYG